jgi:hypothetical protein
MEAARCGWSDLGQSTAERPSKQMAVEVGGCHLGEEFVVRVESGDGVQLRGTTGTLGSSLTTQWQREGRL